MPSPIERLIDQSMRCTICGQPRGCGCWEDCKKCGWSFEAGKECRNPAHVVEDACDQLTALVVAEVVDDMREKYPQAMKAASGGFQKTLRAVVSRRVKATLMVVYEAKKAFNP